MRNVSIALKTPQVRNTPIQIHVKIRFRHSELGITAGRPSFSCRPTQRMKAGMSAMETMSKASVAGDLMLDVLLVNELE